VDTKRLWPWAGPVAGIVALLLAFLRCRRRRCCDPAAGAWPVAPTWGSDGKLTNLAGFVAFVDDADPCWRYDAISSALAVLGVDPGGDAPVAPVLVERSPSAGSGEVDVILIREVDGDDAVAAERHRFTFVDEGFVGGTPGAFRLLDGLRQLRCHPGRGQTDWGTDPCL
jgi:hypothetical protein